MPDPSKSRLHDYEAGWFTLLVSMGVATKKQAEAAMNRVAQQVINDLETRRKRRRRRGA